MSKYDIHKKIISETYQGSNIQQILESVDYHQLEIEKGERRSFSEEKHDRNPDGTFAPKGTGAGPTKKPKEVKTSKANAEYTDASKVVGQNCANCKHLVRDKLSGNLSCVKVDGFISPEGWSVFWEPSKAEEDPTRV